MMRIRAFAKINLTLRVLGVRGDGYHELRTTFQSLALHDTLTFSRSNEFSVDCDDPACPTDRANLIWRAAEETWRAAGKRGRVRGVRVALSKRIPMQAGLGGGSSDAAAALRACAALWKVKEPAIEEIARGLGADVPFFLHGGTALGVERGDLLFPLADWPVSWVVLVVPDFGVSTKDAYAWWDAGKKPPDPFLNGPKRRANGQKTSRPFFPELWNDLEGAVAERHPEIGRLAGALRRRGASYAAMSGSGSVVFGLFDRRNTAEKCAIAVSGPGRRVVVTRTLARRAFLTRSKPQGLPL